MPKDKAEQREQSVELAHVWSDPPVEEIGAPDRTLSNKAYLRELTRLEIELVKLHEWIKPGLKLVVVFEGRDAAGKGGAIKTISLQPEPALLPRRRPGHADRAREDAVVFPALRRRTCRPPARWCCSTGAGTTGPGVEHVMGFCTEEEYREFLRSCPEFERMLVRSGIILVKYWFSVSDDEQERRFQSRLEDPTKRWKLSPMDLGVARALGRVLEGQGRDVRLHRHQAGALVRGQRRRQEARPAELHPPPAEPDPVRGPDARADRPAAAPARRRLHPAADRRPDLRARGLLTAGATTGQTGSGVDCPRRRSVPADRHSALRIASAAMSK